MELHPLVAGFDGIAEQYELGRPGYPPDVAQAIADAAGGPRLLDVGAGTGKLAGPLLALGRDVVAVEPLETMRAVLARSLGAERVLAGTAEAIPLPDASVDGAVSSDAWHWFDGPRAADELRRVVRPGGGVVICELSGAGAKGRVWTIIDELLGELRREAAHPLVGVEDHADGEFDWVPAGFTGHGFAPLQFRADLEFVQHTDRERIVAHVASISFVARLDGARRRRCSTSSTPGCAQPAIDAVEVPYRVNLWITRRLPLSAACRSGGSGELTSIGAPVTGWAKARRAACRNWRSSPSRPARAVLGVAGDRVADRLQVRADLVRAPGLQAHAQQRGRAAAPRSSSKCVTAARGSSVSVDMRVRTRRSRPSGASIVPVRAGGRPSTSARYSRVISRACSAALQRAVDRVGLGDDEQAGGVAVQPVHDPRPRAVLARRAATPSSACASVPGPVPARRVHDDAGGLVDHEQVARPRRGPRRARRPPSRARRPRRGSSTTICSPRAHAVALGHRDAVDAHVAAPRSGAAPARASPSGPARNASSRCARVLRRRAQLHRGGPGAFQDVEQHERRRR